MKGKVVLEASCASWGMLWLAFRMVLLKCAQTCAHENKPMEKPMGTLYEMSGVAISFLQVIEDCSENEHTSHELSKLT